MKRTLTLACLLAIATFAQAQNREFKPFKVDLSVGYGLPAGTGSKAGIVAALEPKYALKDQLSVGLRLEAAIVARATVEGYSAEVKAIGSYVVTSDYYFSTNKSRIFAGAGAGLYQFAASNVTTTDEEVVVMAAYSKFGIVPRLGAELGHFRVAVEYNYVPKEQKIQNSYLSFKLGMFIGGGKYK